MEPLEITPKHPGGRPRIYDRAALVSQVCDAIRIGQTVTATLKALNLEPAYFYNWVAGEEFHEQYSRARVAQAHAIADSVLALADSAVDAEDAQVKRLQVDTRKWFAGKVAPKLYGERSQVEHTGADGGPLVVQFQFEGKKSTAG